MVKNRFISDFKFKETIESLFVVKYIAVMSGKDGREYLNIVLSDKSGDIESRKWSGASDAAAVISKGDYVRAVGKVNQYQNRMQLIVQELERYDEEDIDLSDFIMTSDNPPEKMFEGLMLIVDTLDDVYIKDLLHGILNDQEIQRRLKNWGAAKTIHHAYQGGLLEHTLSCTQLADSLSVHYEVNRNYVIAGTVLHDLCKIYELTDGAAVEYTEEGKLLGHIVKSVEVIDRFASRIKNFPHMTKVHLKHILVSHHGEYEYGSPKIPQTSEAMLVHQIDLMDSKLASFDMVKKTDQLPGHWSGFVRHLDRLVYKDELPHHPEYLSDEITAQKREDTVTKKVQNRKKAPENLKSNQMADMLKDFKVKG